MGVANQELIGDQLGLTKGIDVIRVTVTIARLWLRQIEEMQKSKLPEHRVSGAGRARAWRQCFGAFRNTLRPRCAGPLRLLSGRHKVLSNAEWDATKPNDYSIADGAHRICLSRIFPQHLGGYFEMDFMPRITTVTDLIATSNIFEWRSFASETT